MTDDPIVEAVRRARDQLAAKFDYDLHAIFADLRKREASAGERLVRQLKKPIQPSLTDHAGRVDSGESSLAAG